jgi:hypothetical protein
MGISEMTGTPNDGARNRQSPLILSGLSIMVAHIHSAVSFAKHRQTAVDQVVARFNSIHCLHFLKTLE